jgi:hypothetical protein
MVDHSSVRITHLLTHSKGLPLLLPLLCYTSASPARLSQQLLQQHLHQAVGVK